MDVDQNLDGSEEVVVENLEVKESCSCDVSITYSNNQRSDVRIENK
jgi:hypothetical protein